MLVSRMGTTSSVLGSVTALRLVGPTALPVTDSTLTCNASLRWFRHMSHQVYRSYFGKLFRPVGSTRFLIGRILPFLCASFVLGLSWEVPQSSWLYHLLYFFHRLQTTITSVMNQASYHTFPEYNIISAILSISDEHSEWPNCYRLDRILIHS